MNFYYSLNVVVAVSQRGRHEVKGNEQTYYAEQTIAIVLNENQNHDDDNNDDAKGNDDDDDF